MNPLDNKLRETEERKCLTNGLVLRSEITDGKIRITLETPNQQWGEQTVKVIEERLHDGIEYALAPYWRKAE